MKTKIKYLLVLVLASFVFAGCASMHESKQCEYKTVRLNPGVQNFEAELNDAAKGGWKLFTIVPTEAAGLSGYSQYIFERSKH